MAAAAIDVLVAAFSTWNTNTGDPQSRISVYNGGIPGVPTYRYAVVYAGDPVYSRGSWAALAADAAGYFTVHYAATRPNSLATATNEAIELMRTGNRALVDAVYQVDGLGADIYLEQSSANPPTEVGTVIDRVTAEGSAVFTYATSRT